MTFLNPLALVGLAAAAIPVLLHLLNLRKLQTIDFSTLAFLKELQKTRIRRLKLKQILLLILRTLLVIFLVLAFSRPTLQTSLPGFGSHAKTSVVIVMDNSFSMDVADERGVRLKQAKDAAQSILNALQEGDEVSLVQMANLNDRRFLEFTRNFMVIKEEINKIPVEYTVANLESALKLASASLANSQNINKEVYVITDAQRNIVQESDSLKIFDASASLYVVPIGLDSKAGERNLSVDSLNVQTKIFEAGKNVDIEARIRNSGKEDAKGVIVSLLFNGERMAQRSLDIPAGETRMVPISAVPAKDGAVRASVEVEGDALDADNHRYFGFVIPEKPRIALIGSAADLNFLRLAIQPDNDASPLTSLTPEQLSAVNIGDFSVLMITNIPKFSDNDVIRLQNFVREGGSILLFAGEKSDIASYNASLLPALGLGMATVKEFSREKPAEFTMVDKVHPLFTGVFKGSTGKATVESPKIYRAALLNSAQPIIQAGDGAFLAETKVGNGKVMYCAVPPSSGAWSTFPLTGIFVTIVNRSSAYLSATESAGAEMTVGEAVNISLPKKFAGGGNFKILDPNNTESFRQAAILPGGATLSLESLHQPGVYIIQSADGRRTVQTVAVNPPASESVLAQMTADEIRTKIGIKAASPKQVEVVDNYRNLAQSVARARVGTELWKFLVALALLCALAEMIIAKNSKQEAA